MIVTIPLQEGMQFRMGSLTLKGLTVFKPESLRRLYEMKPGKVYNYGKIEAGQRGGARRSTTPVATSTRTPPRACRAEGRSTGRRRHGPRLRG